MISKAVLIASITTLALAAGKEITIFKGSDGAATPVNSKDCVKFTELFKATAKGCSKVDAGLDKIKSVKFEKFTDENVGLIAYSNDKCSSDEKGKIGTYKIARAKTDVVSNTVTAPTALPCVQIDTITTQNTEDPGNPIDVVAQIHVISTGSAFSMAAGAIILSAAAATQF